MAEETGHDDRGPRPEGLADDPRVGEHAAYSAALLRGLLDTQRLLLQQYQQVLKEGPRDEALMAHHRAALKSLLACWLDMSGSIRRHLDEMVDAQSRFVHEYVQTLDQLLRTPPEKPKS